MLGALSERIDRPLRVATLREMTSHSIIANPRRAPHGWRIFSAAGAARGNESVDVLLLPAPSSSSGRWVRALRPALVLLLSSNETDGGPPMRAAQLRVGIGEAEAGEAEAGGATGAAGARAGLPAGQR